MKPDRLRTLKRFDQYQQGGSRDLMITDTFGEWVKFDDATKLLRREQARVRRIIHIHIKQAEFDQRNSGQGQIYGMVTARVLRSVLAALGKP